MSRAERRAAKFRRPAQHLRITQTVKRFSAPKIVIMRDATTEPMEGLKAWIDTYEDLDAPAMSEQALVLLIGLWLGLTRGLYLNGTPFPREQEREGNNLMSRMESGASMSLADLQRMYELAAQVVNAAIKINGWEVWAEAATDLAIKNELALRQSDSYWLGGWKHA